MRSAHIVVVILAAFGVAATASFFLNGVCPAGFGLRLNSCWSTKLVSEYTAANKTDTVVAWAAPSKTKKPQPSPLLPPAVPDLTLNHTSSEAEDQLLLLRNVLENTATPDKLVIITVLNEAWAAPGSMLDLFLESFRIGIDTQPLLRHLLLVTVDPKAYARCKATDQHCFFLTIPGVDFTQEKPYMTKDYLELMWRRIEFLGTVLQLGYDFVFCDLDIMWLRDPLPELFSGHKHGVDFTIACDRYNGNPYNLSNYVNAGFMYIRANNRTVRFFRYWYKTREGHSGANEQSMLDRIKGNEFVTGLGVKFRFLDPAYFSGFCHPSRDPYKLRTMHANCCIGMQNKIRDLRLLLDIWANFTSSLLKADGTHGSEPSGDGGSKFVWSFPAAKTCRI